VKLRKERDGRVCLWNMIRGKEWNDIVLFIKCYIIGESVKCQSEHHDCLGLNTDWK
jgi:hypothetical protein